MSEEEFKKEEFIRVKVEEPSYEQANMVINGIICWLENWLTEHTCETLFPTLKDINGKNSIWRRYRENREKKERSIVEFWNGLHPLYRERLYDYYVDLLKRTKEGLK